MSLFVLAWIQALWIHNRLVYFQFALDGKPSNSTSVCNE